MRKTAIEYLSGFRYRKNALLSFAIAAALLVGVFMSLGSINGYAAVGSVFCDEFDKTDSGKYGGTSDPWGMVYSANMQNADHGAPTKNPPLYEESRNGKTGVLRSPTNNSNRLHDLFTLAPNEAQLDQGKSITGFETLVCGLPGAPNDTDQTAGGIYLLRIGGDPGIALTLRIGNNNSTNYFLRLDGCSPNIPGTQGSGAMFDQNFNTNVPVGSWLKIMVTYSYNQLTKDLSITLKTASEDGTNVRSFPVCHVIFESSAPRANGQTQHTAAVFQPNFQVGIGSSPSLDQAKYFDYFHVSYDGGQTHDEEHGITPPTSGTSSPSSTSSAASSGTSSGSGPVITDDPGQWKDTSVYAGGDYFKSDSFDADSGKWITVAANQSRGAPDFAAGGQAANDYKITTFGGRSVLKSAVGNAAGSPLMTTPKNLYWDQDRRILSTQTVMRVDGGNAYNALYMYSDGSKNSIFLEMMHESGGNPNNLAIRGGVFYDYGSNPPANVGSATNGSINSVVINTINTNIPIAEWVVVNVAYTYGTNSLGIKATVSKEDGTSLYTVMDRTFYFSPSTAPSGSFAFPNSAFKPGFKVGIGSGNAAETTYVDSFSVTYDLTPAEAAQNFRDKYNTLLNKASITSADEQALTDMLRELFALPSDAYAIIKDEILDKAEIQAGKLYGTQWSAYNSLYGFLFNLTEADASNYKAQINDAVTDFGKLPQLLQMARCRQKEKLDVLKLSNDRRNPKDTSDFWEDFEGSTDANGLPERWEIPYANTPDHYLKTMPDPFDSTNTVAAIDGNSVIASVKNDYWPYECMMTSAEFKWMAQQKYTYTKDPNDPANANDATNPNSGDYYSRNQFSFLYSFEDMGNYYVVLTNNGAVWRVASWVEGSQTFTLMGQYFLTSEKKIDIWNWCDVSISYYSNDRASFTIVDKDDHTFTINSMPYFRDGKLALGHDQNGAGITSAVYSSAGPMLIDDLNVKFTLGDWDTNLSVENIGIKPYYVTNVWTNPGQTVEIQGESLGLAVESVRIMRIPDTYDGTGNAQYVPQPNFQNEGYYNVLSPGIDASWNDALAVDAEIYHAARESIKFLLPFKDYDGTKMKDGAFAVKLFPAGGSSIEPVVIYINNPQVRYIIGDQGDIVTSGNGNDSWMKIVGSNLSPQTGDIAPTDIRVRLRPIGGGTEIPLGIPILDEDSAYALKLIIPDTVADGDYEVFTYNGYGDATVWSAPYKITVGADPRSKWPHYKDKGNKNNTFNVKSFGAIGDENQNADAYVVAALQAAYENGGGEVYFPAGAYFLHQPVIVPPNTTIRGDGNSSVLIFNASYYQYLEIPESWIIVTHDAEITNLQLFATRMKNMIKSYPTSDARAMPRDEVCNIYVDTVWCTVTYRTGRTGSDGSNETMWATYMTADEIMVLCMNEMNNGAVYYIGGTNVQMKNLQNAMERADTDAPTRMLLLHCDYLQLMNSHLECGTNHGNFQYALMENLEIRMGSLFADRSFCYEYNIKHWDDILNNREGQIAGDGAPAPGAIFKPQMVAGDRFRFGTQNSGKNKNGDWLNTVLPSYMIHGSQASNSNDTDIVKLTKNIGLEQNIRNNFPEYLTVLNTLAEQADEGRVFISSLGGVSDHFRKGLTAYVSEGQGSGQIRIVEDNWRWVSGDYLVVTEPFLIAPNRNSRMFIHARRQSTYRVHETVNNCSTVGAYGTNVDSVYDHYTIGEGGNYLGFAADPSVGWYGSFINSTVEGNGYVHGDGRAGNDNTGISFFDVDGRLGAWVGCVRGMMIRNNHMKDGAYIRVGYQQGGNSNIIIGCVIEDCKVESAGYAIRPISITGSQNYRSFNGLVLHNNDFDESEYYMPQVMANHLTDSNNANNHPKKYQCFMVLNDIPENERGVERGDVNQDGKVSLKDSTMIKLYLLSEWNIDVSQIQVPASNAWAADFNEDARITMADSTLIRKRILETP